MYEHAVPPSKEGSVVWEALQQSAEADNISPNQRNVFYSTAARMQSRSLKSPPVVPLKLFFVGGVFKDIYQSVTLNPFCWHFKKMGSLILCFFFLSCDNSRFGAVHRPLLSYEPHLTVDIISSGESSSGFTSQDSTMERNKIGTFSRTWRFQEVHGLFRVTIKLSSGCFKFLWGTDVLQLPLLYSVSLSCSLVLLKPHSILVD